MIKKCKSHKWTSASADNKRNARNFKFILLYISIQTHFFQNLQTNSLQIIIIIWNEQKIIISFFLTCCFSCCCCCCVRLWCYLWNSSFYAVDTRLLFYFALSKIIKQILKLVLFIELNMLFLICVLALLIIAVLAMVYKLGFLNRFLYKVYKNTVKYANFIFLVLFNFLFEKKRLILKQRSMVAN